MDVSFERFLPSSPAFAVVPFTPPHHDLARRKDDDSGKTCDGDCQEVPFWDPISSASSQGLTHEVPVWSQAEDKESDGQGSVDSMTSPLSERAKRILLKSNEVQTCMRGFQSRRVPSQSDLGLHEEADSELPLTQLSQRSKATSIDKRLKARVIPGRSQGKIKRKLLISTPARSPIKVGVSSDSKVKGHDVRQRKACRNHGKRIKRRLLN